MKKISLLVTSLMFFILRSSFSQDCEMYFPSQKGSVREMKYYDERGKLTSISKQTVINSETSTDAFILTILNDVFDDKGEPIFSGEMTMKCKAGTFYFDMDNYLNSQSFTALEEMDFKIEGDNLAFPPDMKTGDVLGDGKVNMTVEQMPLLNTTVTISDRKVESIEEIETEAGKFKCNKITYNIETKSVITIRASAAEWIAKDVGVVRSESYNKKGKLTGYSVLTKLE